MGSLNDVTPEEWDKVSRDFNRKEPKEEPVDSWDLNKRKEIKEVKELNEDPVNHPAHYNKGAIETIDYIVDVLGKHDAMSYCHGNVIKYTGSRLWEKGKPIEDAMKAAWYLNKLIELMKQTKGETW